MTTCQRTVEVIPWGIQSESLAWLALAGWWLTWPGRPLKMASALWLWCAQSPRRKLQAGLADARNLQDFKQLLCRPRAVFLYIRAEPSLKTVIEWGHVRGSRKSSLRLTLSAPLLAP